MEKLSTQSETSGPPLSERPVKKKKNQNPGNSQNTWKVLNTIVNCSKTTCEQTQTINVSGKFVTDPHHIAEQFNTYFTNIGVNHIINTKNLNNDNSE